MSVFDAIDSLGEDSLTVTRIDAGTYVDGRYIESGTSTTFVATGSLQPITGETLRDLPEGQRSDETRLLFTKTLLRARTTTTEPDVVTINGESWIVISAKRWRAFGGAHTEAILARTEAP